MASTRFIVLFYWKLLCERFFSVKEFKLSAECTNIFLRDIYLEPLSYGMPSAFGASDFLEVNASTMREIMYGSML